MKEVKKVDVNSIGCLRGQQNDIYYYKKSENALRLTKLNVFTLEEENQGQEIEDTTVVLAKQVKGEDKEKDFRLEDQYIATSIDKKKWVIFQLTSPNKKIAEFQIEIQEGNFKPYFFNFGEKLKDKAILKATFDPDFDQDSDQVTDIDGGADIFCFCRDNLIVNIYAFQQGNRIIKSKLKIGFFQTYPFIATQTVEGTTKAGDKFVTTEYSMRYDQERMSKIKHKGRWRQKPAIFPVGVLKGETEIPQDQIITHQLREEGIISTEKRNEGRVMRKKNADIVIYKTPCNTVQIIIDKGLSKISIIQDSCLLSGDELKFNEEKISINPLTALLEEDRVICNIHKHAQGIVKVATEQSSFNQLIYKLENGEYTKVYKSKSVDIDLVESPHVSSPDEQSLYREIKIPGSFQKHHRFFMYSQDKLLIVLHNNHDIIIVYYDPTNLNAEKVENYYLEDEQIKKEEENAFLKDYQNGKRIGQRKSDRFTRIDFGKQCIDSRSPPKAISFVFEKKQKKLREGGPIQLAFADGTGPIYLAVIQLDGSPSKLFKLQLAEDDEINRSHFSFLQQTRRDGTVIFVLSITKSKYQANVYEYTQIKQSQVVLSAIRRVYSQKGDESLQISPFFGNNLLSRKSVEGYQFKGIFVALGPSQAKMNFNYENDFAIFGYQEFYDASHDGKSILISACLHDQYVQSDLFTNKERLWILEETVGIIESLAYGGVEDFLSLSLDPSESNFLIGRNFLGGKAFIDLYFEDKNMIEKVLTQEQIPDCPHLLSDYGIQKNQRSLGCDFNMMSLLERTVEAGNFHSTQVILEIFLNKHHFEMRNYAMKIIPTLIQGWPDEMTLFLSFPPQIEGASFEERLLDDSLPLASIHEFRSFHLTSPISKKEIAWKIFEKSEKIKNQEGELVDHTVIDFNYYLISQKLKNKKETKFGELELVKLLSNLASDELFECKTVQKIIDRHTMQTSGPVQSAFWVYVLGFALPFAITIFAESRPIQITCYSLGLAVQSFFFFLEAAQMKNQGLKEYIIKIWNHIDIFQIIFYVIIAIKGFAGTPDNEDKEEDILKIVLQLLVVVLCFFKVLYMLRFFKSFGFLVQMVFLTIFEVIPFLVFMILWITLFSLTQAILRLKIGSEEDPSEGDYPYVNNVAMIFIQTFRNSMGDIAVPDYTDWFPDEDDSGQLTFNIYLIINFAWFFWLANIFVNLIILLNFLIAVISQTYEQVMSNKFAHIYKNRAKLNFEALSLIEEIKPSGNISALVFTTQQQRKGRSEWEGILKAMKKSLKQNTQSIQKEIQRNQERQEQQMADIKATLEQQMAEIKATQKENQAREKKQMADIQSSLAKILEK